MGGADRAGTFVFSEPQVQPRKTSLYEAHLRLTDKSRLAAFAGYLMPLWYSSISSEHKAVRETAGLFDCTHMGVMEVVGRDAEKFLNLISTNEVSKLSDGAAQYSYILDAAGNVLDDIIVYRRKADKFMVVVNAANKNKISAYIDSLPNEGDFEVRPCDKVDIALQGPASAETLTNAGGDAQRLSALKSFHFFETTLSGIDVIIARTGYTGAKIGFELFVHPERAAALWELILEKGQVFAVEPCGLGARDSLRIEAGLPLYGHELNGEYSISPFESGYGWAVKLEKEFFIGKAVMEQRAAGYDMEIVRLKLPGQKGIRPVRQHDGVLDGSGKCVGWVTSCAGVGQSQVALAYVMRGALKERQDAGVYYLARSQRQAQQGRKKQAEKMEMLLADLTGKTVSRFAKF